MTEAVAKWCYYLFIWGFSANPLHCNNRGTPRRDNKGHLKILSFKGWRWKKKRGKNGDSVEEVGQGGRGDFFP